MEDYFRYSKTSIAARAAFREDRSAAHCWSRSEGDTSVKHSIWKTTYLSFSGVNDLEKPITNKFSNGYRDLVQSVEFDSILDIRPAMWITRDENRSV